jgi:hypothetical protein
MLGPQSDPVTVSAHGRSDWCQGWYSKPLPKPYEDSRSPSALPDMKNKNEPSTSGAAPLSYNGSIV